MSTSRFARAFYATTIVLAALLLSTAELDASVQKQISKLAEPGRFNRPVSEEGFATQTMAFAQDGTGFLWMGTQDGLARYDGIKFVGFQNDPEDPLSLPSSWVSDLVADKAGHIWAAGDRGLHFYNEASNSFETIPLLSLKAKGETEDDAEYSDVVATALHLDSSGMLWAALSDFGIASIDTETRTVTIYRDALAQVTVTDILDDGKGVLWLGTVNDGVIGFDPAKKTIAKEFRNTSGDTTELVDDQIIALAWDEIGKTLWVGTVNTGVDQLDLKTGKATHHTNRATDPSSISQNKVNFLLVDSKKSLWVGTPAGLNHYDKATKTFIRYRHDAGDATSISFDIVISGFEDNAGVLWFGTIGSGVSTFDQLSMDFQYHRLGMSLGFAEDSDGNLWVGTAGSGLYKYDHQTAEKINYTSFGLPGDEDYFDLKGSKLAAMLFDKKGVLWILAYPNGMLSFDPKTEDYQVFDQITSDTITSDFMMDFVPDDKGNFWIASHGEGAGLMYFNKAAQTFSALTMEDGDLPSDNLFTVRIDRSNSDLLWIGTGDAGLASFNVATEEANSYIFEQEFANQAIEYIHQDAQGILWFGTEKGLGRFDPRKPETVELVELGEGLNHETIFAILEDQEQRLWIATNNSGLIVYDKKTKASFSYRESDGIQANEFAQQAFYQSPSGKMIFGGFKGFNFFDPTKIVPDTFVPPIVLTDFLLFGKSHPLKDAIWNRPKVALDYTENDITIEFAALSFASPGRNQFRYKLVGVDKDWKVQDASRAFASYPNMEFGNYTFKVQAKGRHGTWNEEQATLAIHVDRPPWRTWWAYLAYASVAGILVFFYLRFQKQKLTSLANQANLAKVERDLELTGAVQTGFLPTEPSFKNQAFELYGVYHAAESTSGDWWWHTLHDGWHFVLVGDVTGHGPGPAMVTAAVATAFRVQPKEKDIVSRFETINQEVRRVGRGKYMMALSVLAIEETTGKYLYYSMGGLPALRCSGPQSSTVAARGTLLGDANFSVGVNEGTLRSGDRVMLYTDGIPEIEMAGGRQLGMRGFMREYKRSRELPLAQAAREMVDLALRIDAAAIQEDDWTFVMIKWDQEI